MNKRFATLIGALTLSASLPALAGPDFQTIEQARQAKRAQLAAVAAASAMESGDCDAMRVALLLDHGPRAQSTPYLNERRKERLFAQISACKDAAKSSAGG